MTQKLLTLPFRLGFGAARTAVDLSAKTIELSTKVAGTAIGVLRPGGHPPAGRSSSGPAAESSEPAAESSTSTREAGEQTRSAVASPPRPPAPVGPGGPGGPGGSRESRVNGHSASPSPPPPPPPAAPITPPDELPATPLSREQDVIKTIEDEEEVVAELAEPGAEDGAGAQLDIEPPWEGYAEMNANAVIARISQADPAELALVELYEQTHKKRQTVISAAAKRLRELSPPEPR